MGMLKEFKSFAMRGNVIDMAVGIIIGAAFGNIVSSLVADVIMPPIGFLMGGLDFSQLFINLGSATHPTLAEAQKASAPTINYGVFLNKVINFVIVAFAMFLLIQQMNRFLPKPPPPAASTKDCPHCAMPIPLKATRCGHCTSDFGAA